MTKKENSKLISFFSTFFLLTFHVGLFAWLWYHEYNPNLLLPFYRRGSYIIILLFFSFLLISNHLFGGLKLGYYKTLDSIVARTLSLFTAYFAMLSPEFRQLVVDRIKSVNPRQLNTNE